MSVVVVTGSGGLIGSEAARHFASLGLEVVGVDNDMRKVFFGAEASTAWNASKLAEELGSSYTHVDLDIRDRVAVDQLFAKYGSAIELVVHCAAQPSHDWAARDPFTDFDVNAGGTLAVLEATRTHCPEATFIFTSTNKVYGDTPNRMPLVELETRYELPEDHEYFNGITESMSIDATLHSVFGASKVAADIMVQEYGRYFDMHTSCFRGGTLTGPQHSATELHGFLGYLMKCAMSGTHYTVHGYKAKQVRDAIHSSDLVSAFEQVWRAPRLGGEVYNIGGGRYSEVSMREGIAMCEEITGREMSWSYSETNRIGDHMWWVGSNARFESHYPEWQQHYDVRRILEEMHEANTERWS
jgi:CDP-paratose 2-epimerase